MPVTVSFGDGLTAEIEGGVWASKNAILERGLRIFSIERLEAYTPWSDYTIAEMAVKALGGEITEAIDPSQDKPGTIY